MFYGSACFCHLFYFLTSGPWTSGFSSSGLASPLLGFGSIGPFPPCVTFDVETTLMFVEDIVRGTTTSNERHEIRLCWEDRLGNLISRSTAKLEMIPHALLSVLGVLVVTSKCSHNLASLLHLSRSTNGLFKLPHGPFSVHERNRV